MSTYNLILNGTITSLTSSGTGNVALNNSTLDDLLSYTTTSNIVLQNSDVLYLEVDLSKQIKTNNILLGTSDNINTTGISFYYKVYESDTYIHLNTNANGNFYFTTTPVNLAPRYIRCVISGIDITLNNFSITNSEYYIGFGEDGTASAVAIEDAPIGYTGKLQEIPIYNNGTLPANAYVTIDYKGDDTDKFIQLSSKSEGPFTDLSFGCASLGVGSYGDLDFKHGLFDNTIIDPVSGYIELADKHIYSIEGYVGFLPIINASFYNKPFGINSVITYDYDHDCNYVAFWEGNDNSSADLKLYKFTTSDNTWEFRATLSVGDHYAKRAAICYHDNYIYFMLKSGHDFFRHDLFGPPDNIEVLSTPVETYSESYNNKCIVSGRANSIYVVSDATTTDRCLLIYDTIQNSWSKGVDPPALNLSEDVRRTLIYDPVRDCILYLSCSNTHKWLCRYNILSNSWVSQYFNLETYICEDITYLNMYLFNDKLYFIGYDLGLTIKILNLSDFTVSEQSLLFRPDPSQRPYIIVGNSQASQSGPALYCFNIYGEPNRVYGYNTGFELSESNTTVSGTYTTPIIYTSDSAYSSYFMMEECSVTDDTFLSKDPSYYKGTIEIRTSNIKPLNLNRAIFARIDTNPSITGIDVYNNSTVSLSTLSMRYKCFIDTDFKTGNVVYASQLDFSGLYKVGFISYNGSDLGNVTTTFNILNTIRCKCDGISGVWILSSTLHLRRFNGPPNIVLTADKSLSETPYDIAPDEVGSSVWYTLLSTETLYKIDAYGNTELYIKLHYPAALASCNDGGCWVSMNAAYKINKYDKDGNLIRSIDWSGTISYMASDYNGGFYFIDLPTDGNVYHCLSTGYIKGPVSGVYFGNRIKGGKNSCIVYSTEYDFIKFVDFSNMSFTTIRDFGSGSTFSDAALFTHDIESQQSFLSKPDTERLLPLPYDPIWGDMSNLDWQEVPKNGYFLEKTKYHQVRVTLRSYVDGETPQLKNIIMTPAVLLEDIQPNSTKTLYVRTNIPSNTTANSYTNSLRVWWTLD